VATAPAAASSKQSPKNYGRPQSRNQQLKN